MYRNRLTAALFAMALVVAACGGSDGSDASDPGATPDTKPVADSELDMDAMLRIAWVAPTSLDPHKSSIASDLYVLYPIYDRLVHQTPDVKPVPGLATSWTFSDDGSEMEMELRPDVEFQDGAPFNAEAVKANIERAQTLPESAVTTDLEMVTGVEVVDDLTVRFLLDGSAASLPMILSAQSGMMISPDALDNPDLDQKPVGAGMFKVTEYQEGASLVAEKWDGYWDPSAVKVAGFSVMISPDFTARFNALRSGQIDATRLEPGQAPDLASNGLELLEQHSIEIGMLSFNRGKAPLDDMAVRQAMNYAIDREAIVDGVFGGLGVPNNQIYNESSIAYSDDVPKDQYAYDPEKARTMLADAGYADGFDIEVNVAALDFVVAYAEAIQDQLKDVGVRVKINKVELSQYGDVVYAQANGNGTAVMGAARADPSQTALQFQPDAFTNPGGGSSPEVQKLYAESLDQTQSEDERSEVLQELSKTLTDQAFVLMIFNPINPWGMSDKVVGMQDWQNVIEFRGVGIKK